MAKIISNNKEYSLLTFDSEEEFEEAIIKNKDFLFGEDTIYIDAKKVIGEGENRGIPDAFLIDFFDINEPRLYLVENELASHNVFSHISEQLARFKASTISSTNQIRDKIVDYIRDSSELLDSINKKVEKSEFQNLEELMISLTEEEEINIVVAIDEETIDLNETLNIFANPPNVVILQRFESNGEIAYLYEPMREEKEDLEEGSNEGEEKEFDTIVCAARRDGFKRAYLENDAWWEVRLSQEARNKLKYLAIYENAPRAEIKHVAEIDKIEPYKDTGNYKFHLKNKHKIAPIELEDRYAAPQGPRYTTYEKLTSVNKVSELWN